MEKISGLILDVFDDPSGQVLKGLYPRRADLPEMVKAASVVSPEQIAQLPDDVFALVLEQGDTTLRKYACLDGGHTLLNIGYFLVNYDKLPVEAIKTAASNLITACGWYDIEPPEELKKLSTGNLDVVGRQRIWKDTSGATYGSDGTSWDIQKTADVIGTADMPTQFGKDDLRSKLKTPLSSPKTAAGIGHLVDVNASDIGDVSSLNAAKGDEDTILEQAFGIRESNPAAFPQVKKTLEPHVDVTDKEPPTFLEKKEASYYALPDEKRYPLDSYTQVKAASAYFDEYHRMMEPEDRHTFAVHLLQRATPLEIAVSAIAQDYGQTKYASDSHIEACLGQRFLLLAPHAEGGQEPVKVASAHAIGLYQGLLTNRPILAPDVFARTLAGIDKIAGLDEYWDQDVVDPFASTFAKNAEEDATKDALVVGNEYMSLQALRHFVMQKPDVLRRKFSEEFVNEFQADPKGIFESLPMDQKLVIMRIVNSANETTAT
jgi:hypothetical protein